MRRPLWPAGRSGPSTTALTPHPQPSSGLGPVPLPNLQVTRMSYCRFHTCFRNCRTWDREVACPMGHVSCGILAQPHRAAGTQPSLGASETLGLQVGPLGATGPWARWPQARTEGLTLGLSRVRIPAPSRTFHQKPGPPSQHPKSPYIQSDAGDTALSKTDSALPQALTFREMTHMQEALLQEGTCPGREGGASEMTPWPGAWGLGEQPRPQQTGQHGDIPRSRAGRPSAPRLRHPPRAEKLPDPQNLRGF